MGLERRGGEPGLAEVRCAVLAARDARQVRLDSFIARAGGRTCVIAVSTIIPGVDKRPVGAELLTRAALAWFWRREWMGASADRVPLAREGAAEATSPVVSSLQEHSEDVLGEFLLLTETTDARRVKERCVAFESAAPWGRLLDLDVYDAGGRPVTRRDLGLPERRCLICAEQARDCIRLTRHSEAELRVRVDALLRSPAFGPYREPVPQRPCQA